MINVFKQCNLNSWFLLLVLTLITPVISKGQQVGITQNLKKFEGYYQLQGNKELYFQIIVVGLQLKQIQLWNFVENLLDQRSELEFSNPKTRFQMRFSADTSGIIKKALVMGKDLWLRNDNFKPKFIPEITAAQTETVKATLDNTAKELIAAINSNSVEQIKKFTSQHVSEALLQSKRIDFEKQLKEMYRSTGGVSFFKDLLFTPRASYAEYQYRSNHLDNLYEFTIKLDEQSKIIMFNNRIISGSVASDFKKGNHELVKSVLAALKALSQKDLFSGTVLIAKGEKILFEYACGEADKETRQKMNLDTKISLGSMNKMFTSLSIMQLAEKGKLSLNDPVSKYLDTTWMSKSLAQKVTIHHLLSHTSGTGDMFRETYLNSPIRDLKTLADYNSFVKVTKLDFEPGTKWSYSNSGMFLLGVIIEKASGSNYFDYIRQNIYKPAGMTQSDVYDLKDKPVNIAIGYIPQTDGSFIDIRNSRYIKGTPAGGGYSTIHDLHRFALALKAGKLVSASSLQNMLTDYKNKDYGYGFQVMQHKDHLIIGHGGGAPGVNAVEYIFPKSGYTMIVLGNYDNTVPNVRDFILNRLKVNLE
jgi:CubicO group peptidase (beta-lactamase class C family)